MIEALALIPTFALLNRFRGGFFTGPEKAYRARGPTENLAFLEAVRPWVWALVMGLTSCFCGILLRNRRRIWRGMTP